MNCPFEPMLASGNKKNIDIDSMPVGQWVMEKKLDGHRLIVAKKNGTILGWSRNGLARIIPPHLLEAMRNLGDGVYDGELYNPKGTCTDVVALEKSTDLVYAIFDLLAVKMPNGEFSAITMLRSAERRDLLVYAGHKLEGSTVYVVDQWEPSKAQLAKIFADGGEGAILKKVGVPYEPGKRSKFWIKFKRKQYAILTLVGFEEGKLGPHSKLMLKDTDGRDVTVKALNDAWRAEFAKRGHKLIGAKVAIDYTIRTASGGYQQPHVDHFPNGEVR